ncbi:MAG: T9SS type A sorting domain-containing protein [Flavobacteriales bacterium]|nr:T9SS type A sorting domain-containing protein [Flavobacteriales bacterium]
MNEDDWNARKTGLLHPADQNMTLPAKIFGELKQRIFYFYHQISKSEDMKTIKTLSLLVGGIFFSSVVSAQSVTGLKWNTSVQSQVQLVKLNPTNGDVLSPVKSIQLQSGTNYIPGTMHHDGSNDLLFFMTGAQNNFQGFVTSKLVLTRASSGEVLRTMDVTGSMAPFIISERNELGFIGTERESHGYGNNDDVISLKVFDLNKGKARVSVKLPNLSFASVNAPFVGDAPQMNGTKSAGKHLALSSTCYISDSKEIVFSATDVMGVQRLFRIDVESGELINALSLDVEVLDMAFDAESKKLHALYIIKEVSGKTYLEVGTLNINSRMITDATRIREIATSEYPVMDGTIKVGESSVYVSKQNMSGKQEIYTVDHADHSLIQSVAQPTSIEKVDFEFPYMPTDAGSTNLSNLISVYPNPTTDQVTLASNARALVTNVVIRNNLGQTVQVIDINSGLTENTLNISYLAPGMYTLEISTDKSTPVVEKLVVH